MADDHVDNAQDELVQDNTFNNDRLGTEWQMETVSLEVDNELQVGDSKSMCDTVVFEQELSPTIADQASNTSIAQTYFLEMNKFEEMKSLETNSSEFVAPNRDITSELPSSTAMLTSYYDQPSINPEVSTTNNVDEQGLECVTVLIPDDSSFVTELPDVEGLNLGSDIESRTKFSPPRNSSFGELPSGDFIANTENPPSNKLSKLFAEDKFGSDREGKAFFDVLSQGISISNTEHLSGEETFTTIYLRADEYYDSWIPKPPTKQFLKNLNLAQATHLSNDEVLTMPGAIITEDLRDPVRDLARQYLGDEAANARVILTADSVSQDEEGLLKLVSLGYYRAAVNLTTRLLNMFGQGLNKAGCPSTHTPLSLQVWLIRLTLLAKLRLFNMAEAESEPFKDLDQPDLYYEFYPDLYQGRKGSMVPFALRILLPQIHTCVGKYGEALDSLYAILGVVVKMIESLEQNLSEDGNNVDIPEIRKQESLSLWRQREEKVVFTIVNCLVAQNDFQSAYSLLDTILVKSPGAIANVRSIQGQILLQLGDVKGAKLLFGSAASARGTQPSDTVTNLLEKAALSIANSNFFEGYCILKEAQTIDPDNSVVINNMAVCLLYMGKLRSSCQLLENAINSNPKLYMHECVLVNICTLYDLESSRSLQKKSNILEIVNKHSGDSFNGFCLKLPAPT